MTTTEIRARFLFAVLAVMLLCAARAVNAQCPQFNAYNGDEPTDFTHCIEPDSTGHCQAVQQKVNGVYPNGQYPACTCPDGTVQAGHGHWEYTHLQTDGAQTEEKDYLTEPQAMEEDFKNQDPNGTATRTSVDQTARFGANEPVRFYLALSQEQNPSGQYWQVDEWIGPGTDESGALRGLTWTERFFECTSNVACATVNGQPALGGYWGTHAQEFGYQADCGDPLLADPDPLRNPNCGALFVSCP